MIIKVKEIENLAQCVDIKVVDNIRTKGPDLKNATVKIKFKENAITFNKCNLEEDCLECKGFVIPLLTIYKASRSMVMDMMENIDFDIMKCLTRKNLIYRCTIILESSIVDYIVDLLDIGRMSMVDVVKMERNGLITEDETNEINEKIMDVIIDKTKKTDNCD